MKKLIAAIMLILLAVPAFSQPPPNWANSINDSVRAQWEGGSWLTLSVLAMLMLLFLVAIAYMASALIGSRELKMWAKAEFIQVIASSALVLLFLILVQAMVVASSAIAYASSNSMGVNFALPDEASLPPETVAQKQANPFALAHYYFDTQLNCAKKIYRIIFWWNLVIEPLEKLTFPTGGMEEVSGWVFSGPVGMNYWITHSIQFLLLAEYFQRHLLIFIEDNMLTVFLPVGIVLRILPYTRGAGGVIMAIALGLFFIYPMMYALLLGVLLGEFQTVSCLVATPSIYSCDSADPACASLTIAALKEEKIVEDIGLLDEYFFAPIRMLFIASFVFPLVNLTLTLTFIRATMQFFGADVAEMGQGLLKII
jgi:hypothetical protein